MLSASATSRGRRMTIAYDPQNIFAKIILGTLPAYKVYEDDATIAFMDVMPQGTGHTLVIPKNPSRNLLDTDIAVLPDLIATVQKIARAVVSAFSADGVSVLQFNEPAAGQTVFHLHFHVIPRFEGIALQRHAGSIEKAEILQAHAQKIRDALA